jgi:hypothetical protein
MRPLSIILALAIAALAIDGGAAVAAGKHEAPVVALVEGKIRALVQTPAVVTAVKNQNAKHAKLDQAAIDRLDQQWRAEVKAKSGPLSAGVLANALSKYLKKIKADHGGLFTEIFVMDNRGLNVGQSDVTSDYWQGDEAKWQKTFLVGPSAVFVDKVEHDESTQTLQTQVSLAIVDPATKRVIGAATFGIDVAALD